MLERLRKSRTEQKRRTVRAAILLDSVAGLSDQAIARAHGVNRNTVILCIQKCLRFGVQAALGELPRSGKPRRVSDAAIAWVQNSACQKPKELGYAQELWTYGLLTAHLRREARSAGYPELEQVSRSKLHKILMQGELRPHKVRYYVERRVSFAKSRSRVSLDQSLDAWEFNRTRELGDHHRDRPTSSDAGSRTSGRRLPSHDPEARSFRR